MSSPSVIEKKPLRSNQPKIFLVGICKNDILGVKLPSIQQVLQLLFHNLRVELRTLVSSLKYTIGVVLEFWKKAKIPTMLERNCIDKLKKTYEKWRNLQKNMKTPYEKCRKNEAEFRDLIENFIFDIAAPDALQSMKIQEDIHFLLLQRQRGRPGSMCGLDRVLLQKEKRKEKRLEKENKRFEKHRINEGSTINALGDTAGEDNYMVISLSDKSSSSTMIDGENTVIDNNFDVGKLSSVNRGTIHFIDDRMLASMDKCKLSTRDAMHLVTATVGAVLQKLQDFQPGMLLKLENLVINRTTINLMRKDYHRRQAKQVIDKFNIPEVFVLHWDGKLLPEDKGAEKKDRLALVVTGKNTEKLLGIPIIESSSGGNTAEATYNLLDKWKLDELVEIVSFDTTSANTGVNNGAAYLLEKKLGHSLLFLPCRHHISELLVRAVFELNFGKTSAPDVPLFNRFSKFWTNINADNFKSGVSDKEIKRILDSSKVEYLKQFCLNALNSGYARTDYKELLQLSLLFIGENVPGFTQFRSPGATSHARFMSKCLYCLKMFLFREQFKMTATELKSLRSISTFLACIYVPYWFKCVNAINAPREDLTLIKNIITYFDRQVSDALLHKMRNHLWYLSQEAVGLSFFDDNILTEIRQKMVLALDSGGDKDNDENGEITPKKVVATMEDLKRYNKRDMSSFVSPKTMRFFNRLSIDTSFLKADPSTWKGRADFISGKKICEHLNVVNDAAERALKLMTDYNRSLTHNEEEKQFLLQAIEYYREMYPSHKKSSLIKQKY